MRWQVMRAAWLAFALVLLAIWTPPPERRVTQRPATAAEIHQHEMDVLAECMDLYRETGRWCDE